MRKTILFYGAMLALLVFLLKSIEYHYFIRDLSLEFYLGLIAVLFTTLGIWAGLKLTRKKQIVTPTAKEFAFNEDNFKKSGISKREFEVLELMAMGLSNQEIADKMFVSLNTVKTHTSNLFLKLEAKRRIQAIQKAKELGLIP